MKEVTKEIATGVVMYEEPVLSVPEGAEHIMALCLTPALDHSTLDLKNSGKIEGLVRVITKRVGDVTEFDHVNQSKLFRVEGDSLFHFRVVEEVECAGIEKVVEEYLTDERYQYIGLEDPDIVVDRDGTKHVFFTIPFIPKVYDGVLPIDVYMGYAHGSDLRKLTAGTPKIRNAKEFCMGPKSKKKDSSGGRYMLYEAQETVDGEEYSVISKARMQDFSRDWAEEGIVAHPKDFGYDWCATGLSPARMLPKSFIDRGDLDVGILNGCAAPYVENGEKKYGAFRVGLFLFDRETGEIPWISSEPLFEDPDARRITFASDFVLTEEGRGILYAHIDDSFVRAYELSAEMLDGVVPRV